MDKLFSRLVGYIESIIAGLLGLLIGVLYLLMYIPFFIHLGYEYFFKKKRKED